MSFTNLHNFTVDGSSSDADGYAATVILSGQTLYGVANGGSQDSGTVFSVNTNGTGFTRLYSFTAGLFSTNQDGAQPSGKLAISGNTLYGTAYGGGRFGNGSLFALNTDGTGFTNLHNFTALSGTFSTNDDGANPTDGLLLSGNTLYGTTQAGGSSDKGTVFAINTDGTGFTNLYSFTTALPASAPFIYTNNDGTGPVGGLILAGNTLYGTAGGGGSSGQGTVFALSTNGTGFTTLYSFSGDVRDGIGPCGLLLSGDVLYGVTSAGGSVGEGTLFAIKTNGAGFTLVHDFTALDSITSTNSDGIAPIGRLSLSGNTLYGAAYNGGPLTGGAVFSVKTNGTAFAVLHSFNQASASAVDVETNSDGWLPGGGLILSGQTLYGTTVSGGLGGGGTLFAIGVSAPPGFQPLKITAQPINTNTAVGKNLVLSVTATGTGPLFYQWSDNGTNVAGMTSSALALSNLQTTDSGTYQCTVTALGVSITTATNHGVVQVANVPVTVTTNPTNQTVVAGNNAALSVKINASATPPIGYQWKSNGVEILGATTSLLTLINAQNIGTNFYSCVLTNPAGTLETTTNAPEHGRLIVLEDAKSPGVTNIYPAQNAQMGTGTNFAYAGTNLVAPQFSMAGKVTDNGLITNVTITRVFPGTATVPVSLTQPRPGLVTYVNNGPCTLEDGTNIFNITATDSAGNSTTYVQKIFFINNSTALTVVVTNGNGNGTTIPYGSTNFGQAISGNMLQIGRNYHIRALPGNNSIFTNWTDGNNLVLSSSTNLTFIMSSNLVLSANFLTNPIVAAGVAGAYNGLFNTDPADFKSAGFIGNLVVKTNGKYTCTVTVQGKSYPSVPATTLSGVFDNNGNSTLLIKRAAPLSNLVATLHLDWVNLTRQITGSVTNTDLADPWSAAVSLDQAGQYSAAGNYTAQIAPAETGPQGTGYLAITNSPSGNMVLSGKLADGSALAQTVPISKDGLAPLYIRLYSHLGLLEGQISAAGNGTLTWIKLSGATNVITYPEGFTNAVISSGNAYLAPEPGNTAFGSNTNLMLTVHDIEGFATNNAGTDLTWQVQVSSNKLVVIPAGSATNKLSQAADAFGVLLPYINAKNGLMNFKFQSTAGPRKNLTGIINQAHTNAAGYLIGMTNVGSFLLHP